MLYIICFILYLLLLMGVSYFSSRRHADNGAFFSANRSAPWFVVAFGMIGASVSGISVVSVPGMVQSVGWTYLQTCLGFFVGYIAVAYILLPLYYRLNVTSIYQYLSSRFGQSSRLTGAWLFVVAKAVSSASKLFVAAIVLQQFVFEQLGCPFWLTVLICVFVIWLYTQRSGIKTIVWTDSLQTAFLLIAVAVMCIEVVSLVELDFGSVVNTLKDAPHTRIFVMDDFVSSRNFWKQFISGIFIVIVMTGLDQDMMQKNLTCSTLRKSQRNMLCYGAAFLPVNFLLLFLGSMIVLFATNNSVDIPTAPDAILPFVVSHYMSPVAGVAFMISIVAATFSSADSALTAITTSLSVDIFNIKQDDVHHRRLIHLAVSAVFTLMVLVFDSFRGNSVLDTIYTIVGYAYGPLLGLFSFGIITRRMPRGRVVPWIAVLSPIACFAINQLTTALYNYSFGYELLLLNGVITFIALWLVSMGMPKIKGGSIEF